MASLFKKSNSPYWQLRRKADGVWVKASTGLRYDDPIETSQARSLRAKAESKEHQITTKNSLNWDWVEHFLRTSGVAERSVAKYVTNWQWIFLWLIDQKLTINKIRYRHASEYVDWRVGRRKRTGKTAGRNTAIQEIKLFSSILNEAVRRELILANPLANLKLKKTPPKKKPELTDEEINICRAALVLAEEWMRNSFDIALATGCRLSETRIPMHCVDLDSPIPTITFPSPKGGIEKAFSVPIPTSLIAMMRSMKADARTHTIPALPFQPSRAWQHFFQNVGLPHLTFHCLRVTKITRLRREGVPREVAMRLVNHANELIHLLYDRHKVQDLAPYRDAGIGGSERDTHPASIK